MTIETFTHGNEAVALRIGSLIVALDLHGHFLGCAVFADGQLQGVTAKDMRRLPRSSGTSPQYVR